MPITKDLVREYRETMDKEVLHSWAGDAVAELNRLNSVQAQLHSALSDIVVAYGYELASCPYTARARALLARLEGE